jgi:hypothetical protein
LKIQWRFWTAYHQEFDEQQFPKVDPAQVKPLKLVPHRPVVDTAAWAPMALRRRASVVTGRLNMVATSNGLEESVVLE